VEREWSISLEDYSMGWNILFLDIWLKLECFSRGMFYSFVLEALENFVSYKIF